MSDSRDGKRRHGCLLRGRPVLPSSSTCLFLFFLFLFVISTFDQWFEVIKWYWYSSLETHAGGLSLLDIPREVLVAHFFSHLTLRDLVQVGWTCKAFEPIWALGLTEIRYSYQNFEHLRGIFKTFSSMSSLRFGKKTDRSSIPSINRQDRILQF